MITQAPANKNVIIQRPNELHGTPLYIVNRNAQASSVILFFWTVVPVIVLAWICWWGVRSRRAQQARWQGSCDAKSNKAHQRTTAGVTVRAQSTQPAHRIA